MEKDAQDWISGDEPMTGAQASYLKTLSEQAKEPDAFDGTLTKAEASIRIDRLKEQLGLDLSDMLRRSGSGDALPYGPASIPSDGGPLQNSQIT
ncbi:DUF3072 domain-containing protein [Mesorhizobium australicum]|uniref:DUF3072 domain-containing protein n=1 Tax=Mesorhizobium australicum TaxID=536018 RepID=UPI00333B831D